MTDSSLALTSPAPVPAEYAEKAMGSLMKLHAELMDEKDRRVELYRRLMEKEQAVAELKMYVKLLEEKLGKAAPAGAPRPAPREPLRIVRPPVRAAPRPPPPPPPPPAKARGPRPVPAPTRSPASSTPHAQPLPQRRVVDGWKVW